MTLTKQQKWASNKFKHSSTREEQLKDAADYVVERVSSYYDQWGWPTPSTTLLPRLHIQKAPLCTNPEIKAYLIEHKHVIEIFGVDGRRYLIPGNRGLTKEKINELMWRFHNRKKEMGST